MSITYVIAELRHLVQTRAEGRCEYCLIAEEDIGRPARLDKSTDERREQVYAGA